MEGIKVEEIYDKYVNILIKLTMVVGLIFTSILIFVNVVTRYFLNFTIPWAEELTRYIMVWVVFVGSSYCVKKNIHVTMDAVFNRFKDNTKRYILILIYAICSGMSFYLSYMGYVHTRAVYYSQQISPALLLPMWWVYLAYVIGFLLMGIDYLRLFLTNLYSKSPKTIL